jgi:hypothetical protein
MDYDDVKLSNLSEDRLEYVYHDTISLPIIESSVSFMSLRFEDDIEHADHSEVILIQAVRLETRTLTF